MSKSTRGAAYDMLTHDAVLDGTIQKLQEQYFSAKQKMEMAAGEVQHHNERLHMHTPTPPRNAGALTPVNLYAHLYEKELYERNEAQRKFEHWQRETQALEQRLHMFMMTRNREQGDQGVRTANRYSVQHDYASSKPYPPEPEPSPSPSSSCAVS